MTGKYRPQRYIDQPPAVKFGVSVAESTPDLAAPATQLPDTVEDLALDSALERSAVTPTANISATWSQPPGTEPQRYAVRWSTDPAFPADNTGGFDVPYPSCKIPGLTTGTLYYVEIAAVYRSVQGPWCSAESITTEADTTPPDEPEDVGWTWTDTGDLLIVWTDATNDNLRDVEIKVWSDSGKTTQYSQGYSATGTYAWQLSEQRRAQSSPAVLDAAVYIELRSRSYGGIYSSARLPTSQPFKAAPSAPAGLTSSWAGDPSSAGVAGADCVISWTAAPVVRRWVLTIDGVARDVAGNKYTYTLDANSADHGGTPDAILSISLVAYDALGQASSASSTTATNAAPATTTATLGAGFSEMAIAITPSTAADLRDYTLRIIKDGVDQETIRSSSPNLTYRATASGTYQVGVIVNDLFGQPSSESVSGGVFLDALTIAEVRAEALYSDSIGTNFSTSPNDQVLKDGLTGSGITYASSASTYRWTQIERVNSKLIRRITIQLGSGSANFYIATSPNGSTWRWFAGVGGDGHSLTERANEATAQSNVSLISALTNSFAELPAEVDCRYVRVYHRHTSSSYRLDECYARSRLTLDDLDAELIRGMTISGDQFIVNQLSALTASMGALNMDGVISIATGGGIYQGTGSFASPTTGIKLFNSSGVGKLSGYNGGTEQITLDTDGKLKAGAGDVVLDASGITMAQGSGDTNMIKWINGSVRSLEIYAAEIGSTRSAIIQSSTGGTSKINEIIINASVAISSGLTLRSNQGSLSDSYARLGSGQSEIYLPQTGSAWIKAPSLSISFVGSGASSVIELGDLASGNRYAYLDLHGDDTYTDYGTRLIRNNTGANAVSALEHRGTGALRLSAIDAGTVDIYTSNAQRVQVPAGGGLIAVGGLSSNWAGSKETSTSGLKMGVFSGEPGVAYGNGILGYNYLPLTGGSSGREDTSTGAGYLRFKEEGSMQIVMVGNDGTSRQIADYGGQYVGIGVARVTNQRLTINGTGTTSSTYGIVVRDSGSTNNMWVNDAGSGFLRAASWTYGSDRKLKKNAQPLEKAKSDALLDLKLWKFDYISGAADQFGFMADEVQESLPELVHVVDETGTLGLQTTNLVPLLVGGHQAHHARLTDLQTMISAQAAEIAALRAAIDSLKGGGISPGKAH